MYVASMILLLLFIYTNQSSLMNYDSKYFFCNGRIYSDNTGLSQNEITSLCSKITSDDRYVILFTNKDRFSDEKSYTYNSEDFFSSHCFSNKIDCKYDFSICIYLWGGKVIITSGAKAKNIVSQNNRMKVINNMITYLKNGDYYVAINEALTELSKLYFQNGGQNANINKNRNRGNSTFVVFFFIIICLCCCICCYFIYQNRQKSDQELNYTRVVENQKIGNYNNVKNNYDESLKIHNHLVALEKIIENIKRSNPPIKETNQCLICMQPIINTVGTIETGNTRFACQHVYHTACLSRYNLNSCLMCKDTTDNASTIVANYHDSQVLTEEQVKNFIKNLHNIYPPKELRIYSQRYPQEYNNFNDGLMLGLLATSWCMPPPVMIINNGPMGYGYGMGYNEYGYNNYNPPPPNYYDGNPNPDSAVGGFQNNNNIEMTELNNNNGNDGGNFGGFGNNNSNDGGDFGGGDFDAGGDF